MTLLPNELLSVVVIATAFPFASTTERCVVSGLSEGGILPDETNTEGVALSNEIPV